MPDNLKLWNSVEKTDPSHTKKVTQRGGFTAIDAHYQVKLATKAFGAVGHGWGYNCDYKFEGAAVICLLTFWYYRREENEKPLRCEFGPIAGCSEFNGKRLDTDAPKKAMTDALTKAFSHLGFNADVFLGKFDDNKYVQERSIEVEKEEVLAGVRPEEISEYNYALDSGDAVLLVDFLNKYFDPKTGQYNEIVIDAFFAGGEKGTKTKRRNKHGEMISEFWQSIGEYVNSLKAAISNLDDIGIAEYWDDIQPLKKYMQGQLNQNEINYLKSRASTK